MLVLLVFPVGSPVIIGDHIEGVIVGICIREKQYVTYDVSWWDGNTHCNKWLDQHEVKCHDGIVATKIGFF